MQLPVDVHLKLSVISQPDCVPLEVRVNLTLPFNAGYPNPAGRCQAWQNEESNAVRERVRQAFILNFTCILFRMSDKPEGYKLQRNEQENKKGNTERETENHSRRRKKQAAKHYTDLKTD